MPSKMSCVRRGSVSSVRKPIIRKRTVRISTPCALQDCQLGMLTSLGSSGCPEPGTGLTYRLGPWCLATVMVRAGRPRLRCGGHMTYAWRLGVLTPYDQMLRPGRRADMGYISLTQGLGSWSRSLSATSRAWGRWSSM